MSIAELRDFIQDQGWWFEESDDEFTINCSRPDDAPTLNELIDGRSTMTLTIDDDRVVATLDVDRDQYWVFASIEDFADFYERFLIDGIDAM